MGPFGPQPYLERAPAQTFRDLITWQRSHQFVLAIYRMSAAFPEHELFGLTNQLRRASVSVAANIAEECRYYLILTKDLEYAETDAPMLLLEEASKRLEGYIQRILNSDF